MILWGNIFSVMLMAFILWYSLKRFPLRFSIKQVVLLPLLIAIGVILGTYAKISIPLFGPETFEIKFDTLPVMIAGILFGPAWGIISGIIMDWVQLVLYPSSFPFLGFTLNLALTGFFAGVIFKTQRDAKNLMKYSLATVGLVALAVIFTVAITGQFSRRFYLPVSYRWGIGLLMALILLLVGYGFQRIHKYSFESKQEDFMARFTYLVIVCELVIQLLLTSVWLYLMFQIPISFLVIPRMIEAIPMILIFVILGRSLFGWLNRVSKVIE